LLRVRRERLRLSKLALAQQAGIDQRTVTFIEDGINVPSIGTLHSLCKALGITVTTVVNKAERTTRDAD
jgi:DNA-binding XRE family transcriptional regulator